MILISFLFYFAVQDFDRKKLRVYIIAKKKDPLHPPKVAEKAAKMPFAENATKEIIATAAKISIPSRKRSQNVASPSNKKAKVEGFESTTLLVAQKKKGVVISNEEVNLHIPY